MLSWVHITTRLLVVIDQTVVLDCVRWMQWNHMKLFKSRVKSIHMICWLTPTSSYCSAFRLWLNSWRLRRFLSCFASWSSCFCQIETGSSWLALCSAVKHGVENSACIQHEEASENTNGNYMIHPIQSIMILLFSSVCIVIKLQRVPQWVIIRPENYATTLYWLYFLFSLNCILVILYNTIVLTDFYFPIFF